MQRRAVAEVEADASEHGRIHAVLELVGGARRTVSIAVEGEQIVLPPSLVEVLLAAAESLHAGAAVSIIDQQAEISPAQAAKLLGVSRQYVDRLVDTGVLPSRRLTNSTYRRIPVSAVIEHRTTSVRKRAGITSIVDDALAAGLSY